MANLWRRGTSRMKKIKDITLTLAHHIPKIIFAIILVFLCVASIVSSCGVAKGEKTVFIQDKWIFNIAVSIIFVALIVLLKIKLKYQQSAWKT